MEHIIKILTEYKYLILFPLAIVEGTMLAVIAGFLCAGGYLNIWIVLPVIVAADMISDSACFYLGKKGVPVALRRIIYWLGFRPERIYRAKKFIENHPRGFIPLSKITLGIGVVGIYLTGSSGISYQRFIRICLITSVCQYLFYLMIGMLFGSAYARINLYMNYTAVVIIFLFMAFLLFFSIQSIIRKL
ncbi:MAG TPA: hypothetical protein VHT72_05635 [Puia sp.]|nr:hypothetical protein [Puia sp.]